ADAVRFCETARRLRPDLVFGADLIAGFPTESEAAFNNSLSIVDECDLTHLHVFPFSPRPGTPAARMPQLAREVVRERAKRLREKGEAALIRHLEAEVGRERRILVETAETGRIEPFTPARLAAPAEPGTVLRARITGHDGRRLLAEAA
ncbi:MAG: tRNA (N(6)-L-threonylcarbamoyladenosine(37)-C(2))-methylthiotransferase MtaB, partial [Pseudomonadota bacterium]|nr:tRNA (N(6)-L-threonylcarbamoyladenosine(37)-C(2))-methylthiotransferase MtaB [Pseudomonadota bacterium]